MKRLLALSLLGSSLFIGSNPIKADWDYWGLKQSESDSSLYDVYTVDSDTQTATKFTQVCTDGRSGCIDFSKLDWHPSNINGLLVKSSDGTFSEYDLTTNTWSSTDLDYWYEDYSHYVSRNSSIFQSDNSIDFYYKGNYSSTLLSDGTSRIGQDETGISFKNNGLFSGTNGVIVRKTNGDIHIGKNSFVVGNELIDGAHPIWAEDENGSKVPLNIYGSDLQINGVSVQTQIDTNTSDISTNTSNISTNNSNISTNTSNIKNLGSGVAGSTALTAALTALPQTSKESKLSCGVGTGAYSSRYAVGFGCASKVNERVDINAGGSYVFGGSKSYGDGTLDNGVIKAGFVFKLGELNKPTQISMNEKKEFRQEITNLKETNKNMLSKNQKLEDKVFTLMARLERLEKVALGDLKSKDLAVYKLK